MALFSRRKKTDSDDVSADRPEGVIEPGEQPVAPSRTDDAASSETTATPVPNVTISTSSFRGVGAPIDSAPVEDSTPPVAARPSARPPGPMEAPEGFESIPGLRDNALLAGALAEISGQPEPAQLLNVARQLLQGHVFLRVKGDARALLAEGKDLPLAIATRGDEQLVLAYSSGHALTKSVEADGDRDTSAMGQPVMALLKHVLAGPYAGVVLDHASDDARAVLPSALLERMVSEADPDLRIKTALSEKRTESTASTVAEAILAGAPLWIAVAQPEDGGPVGVAESRSATGERFLEVFSHPLELLALGRGDQPVPLQNEQLAKALAGDAGLTGLLVDPAGPWIRLTREHLTDLIALAD
ncbi:SseB family protein [Microbacterium sp.]|uniref:SseB family protein n=1 Tax=Microbacterium sp. TaxID=51671 RepID=UPI0025E2AE32|nr:SseB family protein [Microbacterium sp.]MBT9606781.1 SseB family protein [Microbacterium sp.]